MGPSLPKGDGNSSKCSTSLDFRFLSAVFDAGPETCFWVSFLDLFTGVSAWTMGETSKPLAKSAVSDRTGEEAGEKSGPSSPNTLDSSPFVAEDTGRLLLGDSAGDSKSLLPSMTSTSSSVERGGAERAFSFFEDLLEGAGVAFLAFDTGAVFFDLDFRAGWSFFCVTSSSDSSLCIGD